MSFADNVLAKMKSTPAFRPSNIDTFGDWSIEAGDVIQVEIEGRTENVPVFTSDMSWNGAAETRISSFGNEKREMQDKQTRQTYNTNFGISNRIAAEEQGRYEFETGVGQFADITKNEKGEIVGELRGTSVAASVTDKDTGEFKEAFLNIGAGYRDGKLVTLATLYSELIQLIGKVQILNGYLDFPVGSTGIWIHDGTIEVANSAHVPSSINYLTSIESYATTMKVGSGGIVTQYGTFTPQLITSDLYALGCDPS